MLFHRKLSHSNIFSSTWATSIFHFKWVLPFPVKIHLFKIFTRATPGSSLVQNNLKTIISAQSLVTHLYFQILYENISVPVIIAVVVAITLVILLLIFAKICYSRHHTRRKRVWKAPPTPPTPRLTQYEAPNHNPGHQNEEDPYGRAGSVSGHFSVRQGEHGIHTTLKLFYWGLRFISQGFCQNKSPFEDKTSNGI